MEIRLWEEARVKCGEKINPNLNRFIKTGAFCREALNAQLKAVFIVLDAYIEQGTCLTWSTVACLCCRWSLQTRTAHREPRAAWTRNTDTRWWARGAIVLLYWVSARSVRWAFAEKGLQIECKSLYWYNAFLCVCVCVLGLFQFCKQLLRLEKLFKRQSLPS